MNKLMALLAFATIAGFIGILVWKVPEIDLGIVATLTLALVAFDFVTSARDPRE